MERPAQDNMVETQETHPQNSLEAPYVKIIRDIIHAKIPEHKDSFDIALDEINRQITGERLFVFNSQKYPGVSFLAGHLSVTPDLIKRIASTHQKSSDDVSNQANIAKDEREKQIDHYVYVVQPSFGLGRDGSAISALDMAIARFIHEMPVVAAAIRDGRKVPTVDIYIAGGFTSLGGKVTQDFVDRVKGTNGHKSEGFEPHAQVYAEFVQDSLAKHNFDLDKTRIVLQGVSKGAITSDLTTHYLPEEIKLRTQRLYDNPGGTQERRFGTQVRRAIRLGYGMATELIKRERAGDVPMGAFNTQGAFYNEITKKMHLEDDSEQKKLKSQLFFQVRDFFSFHRGGEVRTLAHGTPLDESQRTFVRVSTPDPVNPDFELKKRVGDYRTQNEDLKGLRKIMISRRNGNISTFATANVFHNFPWERSIGSWAQKMEFVENSRPPSAS